MQKQMNMLCLSYRSELFEHKMSYIRLLSTPSKAMIPAWNIENVSHHQRLRFQLGILRTSPVDCLYVEAKEPSLQN